jgi:hypothetical protein
MEVRYSDEGQEKWVGTTKNKWHKWLERDAHSAEREREREREEKKGETCDTRNMCICNHIAPEVVTNLRFWSINVTVFTAAK